MYRYIYICTCIDISFWRICVTKIQRNNETCVSLVTCFSGLTALGLYAAPGVGACTRTEGLERGRGDDPMKCCWRHQNPGANDIYCWWFRNPKGDHLGCISFVNNGINYLPINRCRISTINSRYPISPNIWFQISKGYTPEKSNMEHHCLEVWFRSFSFLFMGDGVGSSR